MTVLQIFYALFLGAAAIAGLVDVAFPKPRTKSQTRGYGALLVYVAVLGLVTVANWVTAP